MLALDYLVQGIAMAVTAATLYLDAPVAWVYTTATIASISITFTRPAQNSLLPGLTETPADLTAANVVSGVVEGTGKMLGPIIAGILLASSGPWAVFATFAVVTLLGALLVSGLRVDVSTVTPDARVEAGDVWRETLRGSGRSDRRGAPSHRPAHVLRRDRGRRTRCAVRGDRHRAPRHRRSGAGFLSAAFGAGAIVGAASTVALVGRRRLTPSLAGGACCSERRSDWSPSLPSAVSAPVLFAAAGAGRSVGDVSGRTLLQRISPNDVLSRVFGVLEGLTMLALVIGSVGAAILIEAYGVQAALVVVGAFLPVVILLSSGRLLSIDRSAEAPDAERLRLLRDIPFFAPLPAPAMERVLADMFPIEVPDGAVLIREGDPGDLFYVIVEGRVEITRGGEHVSSWDRARTSARSPCCATSRGRPR